VKDAGSDVSTAGERLWLFFYGLLSFLYRMFVTVAIALFIGAQFFFIGVLLALWAVGMMALMPLVRALRYLQTRQPLRERRRRIVAAAAVVVTVLGVLAATVPLPQRSLAQGVVWLPERSILYAGAHGFVRSVHAEPGAQVRAGQTLVERFDPALEAQVATQEARVAELAANYRLEFVTNRPRAEMVREQLDAERAALERTRTRLAELPVKALVDGQFTIRTPQDLSGRWHRQGDIIGYVLGSEAPIVRVVVEQADAGLVAATTRQVHLRLADEVDRVIPAHIARQVPAGRDEAPSQALVGSGGGPLAADPNDPQGRKTLERTFQFDLALDAPLGRHAGYGQRVYVRFDLAPAPLTTQAWRALRRLFLRHFDV
jgi:putative peptide zinc metalloprotease protein